MKRHAIIGRFGQDDREPLPTSQDELVSDLNLLTSGKELDHGISQAIADLTSLALFPTEIGLDLLVLAAHVQAADTRISRATESQDTWTRELRLVVPVSNVARWAAAAPVLKRALDFLTGDRWTIEFRARPGGFAALVPERRGQPIGPRFNGVSLFSGGLDSLIGAIDVLEAGGSPLLVSHAAEGAISKSQEECYEGLNGHYRQRVFERLRVWMSFKTGFVSGVGSEDTTRARSFLFFSIGVFAGTCLTGSFTLRVPENGLVALNVPLDSLRLGALSTRTTHPFYMARWNELLVALGIPGHLENPYWDKTKGEMVAGCSNGSLLRQLVPYSLSCSSPSKGRWQKQKPGHCGYCVPCLIRRAALVASDTTRYRISDLRTQVLDSQCAEGQQVRSFQLAIRRVQDHPTQAKLLIHKSGPLSDEVNHLEEWAGVYLRGLEEVGRLLSDVPVRPS